MTDQHRNPAIDQWLTGGQFADPDRLLTESDQLTGLLNASQWPRGAPPFPADVLKAWAREIVTRRRILNETERAFVIEARKQNWTWESISDALGLGTADEAEQRCDTLEAELTRTHPANDPRPYQV